jgi:hypothetical protein
MFHRILKGSHPTIKLKNSNIVQEEGAGESAEQNLIEIVWTALCVTHQVIASRGNKNSMGPSPGKVTSWLSKTGCEGVGNYKTLSKEVIEETL